MSASGMKSEAKRKQAVWLNAMLLAFFLNGLSPFGLRILAATGLGQEHTQVYLFYWYLAGMVFLLVLRLRRRERLPGAALAIGSAMALSSVGGQVFMGLALAYGAPGNVVYPIAMGASICIVAAGGLLIFKERVGAYGKAGIVVGLLAVVLMSVWG
jgi:drug/metabolite transporter (DMT)-like permease